MAVITLQHSHGEYDILIDRGVLADGDWLSSLLIGVNHIVIVSDQIVAKLYLQQLLQHIQPLDLEIETIILPPGESVKTRETKQSIEDMMLEQGLGRDTLMIALGGGVITDITGFVAATYCRGIPVVYIPTTLLAMVDAAIGGKTAVNTTYGKNMIGCFKQPLRIVCDTDVLTTLSDDEVANGLSEAIKHGIIYDRALFDSLTELLSEDRQDSIINTQAFIDDLTASCRIKCEVVQRDEYESLGERQILNFGHTVAHAIERLNNYSIAHGQAVHSGLWVESRLSNLCGYLSDHAFGQISASLDLIHFSKPAKFDCDTIPALLDYMTLDKKALKQQARFVLLDDIGKVHHRNNQFSFAVDEMLIEQALTDWITHGKN